MRINYTVVLFMLFLLMYSFYHYHYYYFFYAYFWTLIGSSCNVSNYPSGINKIFMILKLLH